MIRTYDLYCLLNKSLSASIYSFKVLEEEEKEEEEEEEEKEEEEEEEKEEDKEDGEEMEEEEEEQGEQEVFITTRKQDINFSVT